MDRVPGLKQLQERKRDLLLESEINRQVLRLELSRIRCRAAQFRRGFGWAGQAWRWGAPVAGFLFARKFNRAAGAFAKGSAVVGALRSLWRFWDSQRRQTNPNGRSKESKDGTD